MIKNDLIVREIYEFPCENLQAFVVHRAKRLIIWLRFNYLASPN